MFQEKHGMRILWKWNGSTHAQIMPAHREQREVNYYGWKGEYKQRTNVNGQKVKKIELICVIFSYYDSRKQKQMGIKMLIGSFIQYRPLSFIVKVIQKGSDGFTSYCIWKTLSEKFSCTVASIKEAVGLITVKSGVKEFAISIKHLSMFVNCCGGKELFKAIWIKRVNSCDQNRIWLKA